MMRILKKLKDSVDWALFGAVLFISIAGILTMDSFLADNRFSTRQTVWLAVSIIVFLAASLIDWQFLRKRSINVSFFLISILALMLLFVTGSVFKGAKSWFDLGSFAFQPVDISKLALVLILAKYFSRRHVEIAHVRHILLSGLYAFLVFVLVLVQPDFGGAIIIFCVWLGMVLVSGISKKHLFSVFAIGITAFILLWVFAFKEYQKNRIVTFVHPFADIRGAGYNAYQSTIAVGSGELLGKGIGYGTQSKLKFLPEYQTDFIFASFAEEWGFVGVTILLGLYGVVLWRILAISYRGETNFEILFGLGVAIIFMSHILIHAGMNIGLLPVTGTTIPFMSYGGSHLLMEFLALGILMGMRNHARTVHKDSERNELIQVH
jgi:rod shape determining protein RodA